MEKRYISLSQRLHIHVDCSGKRIPIEFGWGVVSAGGAMGCSFTTSDEALQAGIEAHELYGSRIVCVTPEMPKEPERRVVRKSIKK